MAKGPTINAAAVRSSGGQATEDSVSIQGWTIRSHHEPIIGDAEIESYKSMLGGVLNIPEIVFGNSYLRLVHERSGTCFSFNALDALKAWKEENLEPLQVDIAEEWQEARQSEIQGHGAMQLEYDWTFTTPYTGTLEGRSQGNGNAVGPCPVEEFVECQDQIDWGMLTSQDPILFYDSFTLYESELNDVGACHLEVKVRCMPKCWFVLLRFWLRVDGSLVRLREARVFCRFDGAGSGGVVLRELRHSEGTFQELTAGGAPPEGPSYRDSDTTATVLQAVAPVGSKLVKREKLEICM
ncbi:hypothetical protein BSKO_03935 [Bryopsis sp. KO-2023]|nr:hypothetical protein BSKO_03935 [Bryopsis sp. KO-2023]